MIKIRLAAPRYKKIKPKFFSRENLTKFGANAVCTLAGAAVGAFLGADSVAGLNDGNLTAGLVALGAGYFGFIGNCIGTVVSRSIEFENAPVEEKKKESKFGTLFAPKREMIFGMA